MRAPTTIAEYVVSFDVRDPCESKPQTKPKLRPKPDLNKPLPPTPIDQGETAILYLYRPLPPLPMSQLRQQSAVQELAEARCAAQPPPPSPVEESKEPQCFVARYISRRKYRRGTKGRRYVPLPGIPEDDSEYEDVMDKDWVVVEQPERRLSESTAASALSNVTAQIKKHVRKVDSDISFACIDARSIERAGK